MKHSIRQRVINEYGLPVTKIETVNGELGSGIFDKNGKEIFEGDRVRIVGENYDADEADTVTFYGGALRIATKLLWQFDGDDLEVVGHVDD